MAVDHEVLQVRHLDDPKLASFRPIGVEASLEVSLVSHEPP
jgi:hypothetical protein